MRMLVRIQVPTADGNRAIQDGSLPAVLEKAMQELEPEAAYFVAEDGKRTFYWFLNMEDQSDLPWVAERFFAGLNATVQTTPAMTFEDVQTGLEKAFG
jgi:hypothetical protein